VASEADLNSMSRAELDALAKEEHLDPDDYNTKADLIEALAELENETEDEKRDRLEARRDELKANGKSKKKRRVVDTDPGGLDPYITDPETAQRERFEGTTSDASTHVEGVVARDVPPDPNDDPNKPSDAEDYDYPPGGDVDIATVEVIEPGAGEHYIRPSLEDWVVLDGSHEAVPDALDGRRAVILDVRVDGEYAEDLIPVEDIDLVTLTVRTRDDYTATLYIPWAAVKDLQKQGRSPMRT
jgi:hypothetical protein